MNFFNRANSKKFVLFDTNVIISCSDFFAQNIHKIKDKVQVCICDVLIAELIKDKEKLKILKDLGS
jgi:rRNA-processing protein FCF1